MTPHASPSRQEQTYLAEPWPNQASELADGVVALSLAPPPLFEMPNLKQRIRTPPPSGNSTTSSVISNSSMHSRNSSGHSIASSNGSGGGGIGGGNGGSGSGSGSGSVNYSPLTRPPQCIKNGSNHGTAAAIQSYLKTQHVKVTTNLHSLLTTSPPELWKAYLLKFLDSYSYFSFSLIFTLFLSEDFGMSDVRAGTIYGAYGAMITVFGLVTGTVIDKLGVAKCLRIGFTLSFISRIIIFLCTSKGLLLGSVLITLPFSNCLGIPVLTVGIRRYTQEEHRGFAFGLFYVVMNVGALVAGPLVDILTLYYNGKEASDGMENESTTNDITTSSSSWIMTNNRAIILSGVVANFIAVFVAFSVREIKVDAATRTKSCNDKEQQTNDNDNGDGIVEGSIHSRGSSGIHGRAPAGNKVSTFQPIKGSSFQILSETVRTPSFHRFLLVCLLTINVRMVFRHLDGTLPKYMVREFGEDTPKGRVYAINPFLIIILVPIITAATTSIDPLLMIHRGTYVSALSVFFLAFSTSLPACVLFVITLSVGEAIWSPRLYDYTMSVAQEGKEGTYMALSSAPLFLAKLPVGFLSGVLLQRYCPEHLEEGEVRHSKTMWWIIGLSTIISPILITLLWGYISGGGKGVRDGGGRDGSIDADGESLVAMHDFHNEERGMSEDDSEHSYQHNPLTTNISLPKVRQPDRSLV